MSARLPKIPAPLQIAPSRARRQFAMRLAQRKAELESTREQEEEPEDAVTETATGAPGDDKVTAKTQEQEVREGHERFAKMWGNIDDSSDDESEGSGVGGEEEAEVEQESGKKSEDGDGDGAVGKEKEEKPVIV